jgi:hypothetical protein
MSWRATSPIVFAGVALAFFLPFATVSCDESVTFTGAELAFGQVEEPSPQSTFDDEIESESTAPALVAFLAAIAGLVLGVARCPGAGVASGIGTVAMIVLGANADPLFGTVDVHVGYALALLGYLTLSVGHLAAWILRRRAKRRALHVARRTVGHV